MDVTTTVTLNTDRLGSRSLPTDEYWLRVEDTTEPGRALAEARETLQLRLFSGADAAILDDARQAVKTAEAALKACYEPITLTALEPEAWEELVAAHPPRKDHDVDDVWNTATLPQAAFLECAPKEWDTARWEAFLKTLSAAERMGLFNTAVAVNARVLDPTVPKDWMGTLD